MAQVVHQPHQILRHSAFGLLGVVRPRFSLVGSTVAVPVAQLVNTSRFFSWRPDSLAFELRAPVLTVVAQCMRAAVETQRSAAAANS
jgi:hypothetical protein